MSIRTLLIALVFVSLLAVPAVAGQGAAPKSLGVFGGWRAYAVNEHGQNVCYMALKTQGTAIKKTKRGPVVLMITERPGENSRDVVSYAAGYNFKPSTDLTVKTGQTGVSMFTQKDTAWSRDAMTDHTLATAIRKNATLSAIGMPAAHGAVAVHDTINLKGAPEAYQAIAKACGIEVESLPKAAPARRTARSGPK